MINAFHDFNLLFIHLEHKIKRIIALSLNLKLTFQFNDKAIILLIFPIQRQGYNSFGAQDQENYSLVVELES